MSAPVEWPRSYGYLYAQTASMNVSPLCIASHFSLKPKRLWSVPGLTEYPDTLAALSPPGVERRRRPAIRLHPTDHEVNLSMNFLRPYSAQLLSVLRIMSGLLVLQHGTTKFLDFPPGPMNDESPLTMSGAAGVIELVCGVLVVVGLFTRPAAFILSGMTAIAYIYAHAGESFLPILNHGELAVLYCFVFLYLAAAGGGPWSIDRAWDSNA